MSHLTSSYTLMPLKYEHVHSAWQLIQALKVEGAEITFTELNSADELLNWVDSESHLVYVAADENHQVFCMVRGRRENTPEKRHAVFLTAATTPFARGSGLAAELTNFALSHMHEFKDVQIARIYVYSDNLPSLNSVAKLGFVHAGTVFMHHLCPKTGLYVDDLIFHKIL